MIFLKSPREIAVMREAGRLVAQAHQVVQEHLKPGILTRELDAHVEQFILAQNCTPSFKGYRGFPASTCIAINEEVVHGIPGSRRIEAGDIVKVDIGIIYKGYHGDSVWTYAVGSISADKRRLLDVTEVALWKGIEQAHPNRTMGDLGAAMQRVAEAAGFNVNRDYGGHGVGRNLHEDPSVPNYGTPGQGLRLRTGLVIAIEPIVSIGSPQTRILEDRWTVISADGQLSAQFEHTVAVTEQGPEVLTVL